MYEHICMEYVLDDLFLAHWLTRFNERPMGSGETVEEKEGICVGSLGKCCSTKCDLEGGHQTKFGYSTDGGTFGKAAAFKMNEVVLKNCEVLKGEVQDETASGVDVSFS